MQLFRALNAVMAFFLELAMLASLAYWGFQQSAVTWQKYLYAIIPVIIAAILWGILAAPKSNTRLPFIPRLIFIFLMFSIASFLLFKAGKPTLALAFLILSSLSVISSYTLKE